MAELQERMAIVETKQAQLEKTQAKILEKLDSIEGTIKRYRGFFGGVLFAVNGLWIFLTAVFYWFTKHS